MTKNAKAAAVEAPATLTMEQMLEGYLKMKAEKEAAEKRAAEAEAKAAKSGGVSITDKGQIAVTFPTGNGSITARYYSWHWDTILKMEKEIREACKSPKATTEAQFRASK